MASSIPLFKVFMAPPAELDAPVLDVLHSGFVTQGPKVEHFEEMLRRFFGNPRVLTLNSATSGLHLAFHLLAKPDDAWPGLMENIDEVLSCPLTCTASNWPVLANRLRIKWVDVDPATCSMDLDDLEAKLSPTTKVILLVHWGGTPVDLDRVARIQQVCFDKYGFRPQVVEDCAHAFGAEHKQLKLGNHGNLWLFTIRVPAAARDQFIGLMKEKGITVSAVHQRNDVHSCVQRFSALLPRLNIVADEIVCLPVGWWLTEDDRKRIVATVREFSSKLASTAVVPAVKTRDRKRLSYASKGYDRLRDTGVFHLLHTFCYDLSNPISAGLFYELQSNLVEVIIHIAAETHVDNSIDTPVPFVENNIKSTLNLLEYARRLPQLKHFIYFSTDEVYGSAADGQAYKESDPHKPSNPYSASKSAAEMICQSYFNTYGVPLYVMNVMNAFGERQHPEKFIPLCMNKILRGETLTIHAYPGAERAGSRWYIHARNIAAAVHFVLKKGTLGEKYNVQGEAEVDNLQIAKFVAKELGKELKYEMHDNPGSRPGHDLRYSLDGTKLRDM
ncbi:MAG: hypothetical protein SGPRY_012197, partial [Prymnesium sp.]